MGANATTKMASSSSSSSSSMSTRTETTRSSSKVRSRGQMARRQSFTSSSSSQQSRHRTRAARAGAASRRSGGDSETPLLGGLTSLDIIFIGFAYAFNLVRTLAVGELFDVAAKALYYCVLSLPFEFWRRWKMSRPAPRRRRRNTTRSRSSAPSPTRTADRTHDRPTDPAACRPDDSPLQLTPFHHLVILLTRFACSNFPHLLPRVLFAEDTMLPFVGWRTGGASWDLLREIRGPDVPFDGDGDGDLRPSFKAIWMGEDARDERADVVVSHPQATTLFYLHGGGFSLGSVSFYAEALLRLRKKVSTIEEDSGYLPRNGRPRCVAVEYDLSPAARFPSPLLQCLRCYAHLVEVEGIDPQSIIVAGDSAGANLAMGLLLAISGQAPGPHGTPHAILNERDWSTLPMPGKALLISPWVDLRPSKAHAFANLRATPLSDSAQRPSSSQPNRPSRDVGSDALTDSIVKYDWDYVASESLLHFAQVYAGVLPEPRRVMGPTGWLSHLCGVLSQGLEADDTHDTHDAATSVMDPARRFARAVRDTLEHPLFEKLSRRREDRASTLAHGQASQLVASSDNASVEQSSPMPRRFVSGLRPLFSAEERRTKGVRGTHELYASFHGSDGDSDVSRTRTTSPATAAARLDAEEALEHDPLLSPILGDWSKVQLEHGILVIWGERERLAADIQAWVDLVRAGKRLPAQQPDESKEDLPPGQDGDDQQQRPAQTPSVIAARRAQIQEVVEHGPGGVHAWPFVSMYLAGSDQERERGLNLLAKFVAAADDPIEATQLHGVPEPFQQSPDSRAFPPPSSPPQNAPIEDDIPDDADRQSHGSMPSDLEEGSDAEDRGRAGGALVGRPFSEDEYREALGLGVHWGSPAGEDEQGPDDGHAGSHPSEATDSSPGHSAAAAPGEHMTWWGHGEEVGRAAAPRAGVIGRCLHDERDERNERDEHDRSEHSDEDLSDDESLDPHHLPAWETEERSPSYYGQAAYAQHDADPSQYGLSYAYRRDFEGLSDITEEASVLSSSVMSTTGLARPNDSLLAARDPEAAAAPHQQGEDILSPETRRMIRLEAVRQLAAEAGVEDFDLDDDEGSAIFSPISEDAYSSGLPLGIGSFAARASEATNEQREPLSIESVLSGATMRGPGGEHSGAPSGDSPALRGEDSRTRSRSGSESGGEAWWAG